MQSTMPTRPLADKLRALVALQQARPPLTDRQICEALKITRQTLWRWRKRIRDLRAGHQGP